MGRRTTVETDQTIVQLANENRALKARVDNLLARHTRYIETSIEFHGDDALTLCRAEHNPADGCVWEHYQRVRNGGEHAHG